MSHNIPEINNASFDTIATLLEKADATAFGNKSSSLSQTQRLAALIASTIELGPHLDPNLATRLAEQVDASDFLRKTGTAAAALGTSSGFKLSSQTTATTPSTQQSSHSNDDKSDNKGYTFKH